MRLYTLVEGGEGEGAYKQSKIPVQELDSQKIGEGAYFQRVYLGGYGRWDNPSTSASST